MEGVMDVREGQRREGVMDGNDSRECVHEYRQLGPVNHWHGVPWRWYRCVHCGHEHRAWLSADTQSYSALGDHHSRQD